MTSPSPSSTAVGICHYCSKFGRTTRDHIIPVSIGGPDGAWNIVRACPQCNFDKAAHWPTCKCERCTAAVARFLSDDRMRERAVAHLNGRLEESEDQIAKVIKALESIQERKTEITKIIAMLVSAPIEYKRA